MHICVFSRFRGIEILYFHVNTFSPTKEVRNLKPWVEVNIGERVPSGQTVILLLGPRDCNVALPALYTLLGCLTKIADVCVNWVRYEIDWKGVYGTAFWSLQLTLRSISSVMSNQSVCWGEYSLVSWLLIYSDEYRPAMMAMARSLPSHNS
jgi:hypothetical protein